MDVDDMTPSMMSGPLPHLRLLAMVELHVLTGGHLTVATTTNLKTGPVVLQCPPYSLQTFLTLAL